MPTEDVSDLRDVVDAINKLCETMKTSYDEYDCEENQDNTESVAETIITNIAGKCDKTDIELMTKTVNQTETHVAAERSDDKIICHESLPELVIARPNKTNILSDFDKEPVTSVLESDTKLGTQKVETCITVKSEGPYKTNIMRDVDKKPVTSVPESNTKLEIQKVETWTTDKTLESDVENDVSVSKPVSAKSVSHKLEQNTTEKSIDRNVETVVNSEFLTAKPKSERDVETVVSITKDIEADITNIDVTVSDSVAELVPCELISEMYYTASSDVSLLSDLDDKPQSEDSDKEKDDRNSVMAGHVAAMRERFESMTRTNTPCPDLMRSASPSFEVFRNFSTSPDHLE